jgi:Cof subfamily protein (haloacid dehalogenase superfamily)
MSRKLIAFDLDGTLFDDDKSIPAENLDALAAAANRNYVLVPATGRMVPGIPANVRALPFCRWYIVSNGAGVYDAAEDRLLLRADIPAELALRCCEHMDALPVIYDCYQGDSGYMTRSMYDNCEEFFPFEPHMYEMVKLLRRPVEELKAFLRQKGEPVQKMQMFFRPRDLALRERELERFPALFPELSATTSVSNNIEINSARAGKGKALRALAAHLGIPPEDTVAFGDGTNDCELLEMAGLGVAMANADPKVKAIADEITDSNNAAGVGKTLWRLLGE